MFDEKILTNLMWEIYERHKNKSKVAASWLATEAALRLDEDGIITVGEATATKEAWYFIGHAHLRQVARQILRKRFESDDEQEAAQHKLFPDLQARYPMAHQSGIEPVYVHLEDTTDEDLEFNIHRLTLEGQAKLKHAAALRAYKENRHREKIK